MQTCVRDGGVTEFTSAFLFYGSRCFILRVSRFCSEGLCGVALSVSAGERPRKEKADAVSELVRARDLELTCVARRVDARFGEDVGVTLRSAPVQHAFVRLVRGGHGDGREESRGRGEDA